MFMGTNNMKIKNALLLEFYEKMYLIRKFEETLYNLATRGVVHGSVHLCLGQEAPAVGTCASITRNDYILPTHRGHGQVLAKGAEPDKLLAEILGRETGYCKGRVGSMHLFNKELNNLGTTGVVGSQLPISTGVGLAIKLQEIESCLLCYFGDGTSNQGWFYEALNMASLWDLPIIYVCVNNLYGMGTPYSRTSKTKIHERASIFGIRAETADGNDVEELYTKTVDLVEMAKKEKKPALLECYTYRQTGHSAFDVRPYRSKEEIEEWKQRDPIMRSEQSLLQRGIEARKLDDIKARVDQIMVAAEKFAVESEYPTFDLSMEM